MFGTKRRTYGTKKSYRTKQSEYGVSKDRDVWGAVPTASSYFDATDDKKHQKENSYRIPISQKILPVGRSKPPSALATKKRRKREKENPPHAPASLDTSSDVSLHVRRNSIDLFDLLKQNKTTTEETFDNLLNGIKLVNRSRIDPRINLSTDSSSYSPVKEESRKDLRFPSPLPIKKRKPYTNKAKRKPVINLTCNGNTSNSINEFNFIIEQAKSNISSCPLTPEAIVNCKNSLLNCNEPSIDIGTPRLSQFNPEKENFKKLLDNSVLNVDGLLSKTFLPSSTPYGKTNKQNELQDYNESLEILNSPILDNLQAKSNDLFDSYADLINDKIIFGHEISVDSNKIENRTDTISIDAKLRMVPMVALERLKESIEKTEDISKNISHYSNVTKFSSTDSDSDTSFHGFPSETEDRIPESLLSLSHHDLQENIEDISVDKAKYSDASNESDSDSSFHGFPFESDDGKSKLSSPMCVGVSIAHSPDLFSCASYEMCFDGDRIQIDNRSTIPINDVSHANKFKNSNDDEKIGGNFKLNLNIPKVLLTRDNQIDAKVKKADIIRNNSKKSNESSSGVFNYLSIDDTERDSNKTNKDLTRNYDDKISKMIPVVVLQRLIDESKEHSKSNSQNNTVEKSTDDTYKEFISNYDDKICKMIPVVVLQKLTNESKEYSRSNKPLLQDVGSMTMVSSDVLRIAVSEFDKDVEKSINNDQAFDNSDHQNVKKCESITSEIPEEINRSPDSNDTVELDGTIVKFYNNEFDERSNSKIGNDSLSQSVFNDTCMFVTKRGLTSNFNNRNSSFVDHRYSFNKLRESEMYYPIESFNYNNPMINTTRRDTMYRKSVAPRRSIFLEPGKRWERSLNTLRNMNKTNLTMNDSAHGLNATLMNDGAKKGRMYNHNVTYLLKLQNPGEYRDSFGDTKYHFQDALSTTRRHSVMIVEEPTLQEEDFENSQISQPSVLSGLYEDSCNDTKVRLSRVSLSESDCDLSSKHRSVVIETETCPELSEDQGLWGSVTARDIVLRRCNQSEPLPFDVCYSPEKLRKCWKIGEGVYGEVFLYKNEEDPLNPIVMKVIPIEGNLIINGDRQKTFSEIISEVVIAMELSDLRNNKDNNTASFNKVNRVRCVQGCYPESLIDLWELYDEQKGSENDNPSVFDENQLYIVLELANGGRDLEAFRFKDAEQSFYLFFQVVFALAVAEQSYQFEHRDLHWGNILISHTDQREIKYNLRGEEYSVPTGNVQGCIIDFTLSRITLPISHLSAARTVYNDLATDPDLFIADGDYQFEIYRLMKEKNANSWKQFEPFTNILWLHYTLDKMITALRYDRTDTRIHQVYIAKLSLLKDAILQYDSCVDFVTSDQCYTLLRDM